MTMKKKKKRHLLFTSLQLNEDSKVNQLQTAVKYLFPYYMKTPFAEVRWRQRTSLPCRQESVLALRRKSRLTRGRRGILAEGWLPSTMSTRRQAEGNW